jgi:stringent starvation protein B
MAETSTKPYFLRALHEWATDNGYTPHLVVQVNEDCRVPAAFVRDGQITLNVSSDATGQLVFGNEYIEFQARFGGKAENVLVPVGAVTAIYARETGSGMGFEVESSTDVSLADSRTSHTAQRSESDSNEPEEKPKRPGLRIVK